MSKKKKIEGPIDIIELSQHVRNVLIDNAKTDTLVYGLLLSLADDVERGVKRASLKKEIQDAVSIAQEQFHILFFNDSDEVPETFLIMSKKKKIEGPIDIIELSPENEDLKE